MTLSKSSDNNRNNLVSVIVPTYNRAKFITKALDSVWEQTYRPIELLVVDDGSKDNTKDLVEEWAAGHREEDSFVTQYIYQENDGAPSARNTGIRNSRGRYLQFLDSDDVLVKEKLSLQIDLMKAEKTPLCICDYVRVDQEGNLQSTSSNNKSIDQIIKDYISLSTSIAVIDKTFFDEEILKWNPALKKYQDRDFNLKLFFVIERFSYVEKFLFKWIRHPGDRIFSRTKTTRKIYWENLKSLLVFSLKHWRSISFRKVGPILYLYKKLLRNALAMGRFIPNRLKFWR